MLNTAMPATMIKVVIPIHAAASPRLRPDGIKDQDSTTRGRLHNKGGITTVRYQSANSPGNSRLCMSHSPKVTSDTPCNTQTAGAPPVPQNFSVTHTLGGPIHTAPATIAACRTVQPLPC